MFKSKAHSTLQSRIVEALLREADYRLYRNLYDAILRDQMLELSPNYQTILVRLAQEGTQAREAAADARMALFDVLEIQESNEDEIARKMGGKG